MNENLNLVEILKDCQKGTKLYSTVFGEVELDSIDVVSSHPICVVFPSGDDSFTKDGKMFDGCDGECVLFPSREQRDWSKFKPKQPKFDPTTLKPFDKVLVKYLEDDYWSCDLFSNITKDGEINPYLCVSGVYDYCIPYNDDTKHLVGTNEEAPEFYRYWEE